MLRRQLPLLAMAGLAAPRLAIAQAAWPDRPLRFIVPFAPGGNTDAVGRLAAQFIQDAIGRSVVVENRGGAGGILGVDVVAKAAPDGYTFVVGSIGAITIAPALERMPYKPLEDLAPVSLLNTNPLVLLGKRNLGITTVPALVARAKAEPEKLTYSSSGIGGLTHVSALLFEALSGTKLTHVPYRGGAQVQIDINAGLVDVMFDNLPSSMAQIKAGKLVALAVTSAERSGALPDVPTVEQAGGAALKGYEASSWFGLLAPSGTPSDIVQRLQQETARALSQPAVKERLLAQGAIPGGNTPAEFARHIDHEHQKWAGVVKASGAKVD